MRSLSLISKCSLLLLIALTLSLVCLAFYDSTRYYIADVECEIVCVTTWATRNKNVADIVYYTIAYTSAFGWIVYLVDFYLNKRNTARSGFFHPFVVLVVFAVLFIAIEWLLFSEFGVIDRVDD